MLMMLMHAQCYEMYNVVVTVPVQHGRAAGPPAAVPHRLACSQSPPGQVLPHRLLFDLVSPSSGALLELRALPLSPSSKGCGWLLGKLLSPDLASFHWSRPWLHCTPPTSTAPTTDATIRTD